MTYYGFDCYRCEVRGEWLFRSDFNDDPEAWLCQDCFMVHRDERRRNREGSGSSAGAYVTSELPKASEASPQGEEDSA